MFLPQILEPGLIAFRQIPERRRRWQRRDLSLGKSSSWTFQPRKGVGDGEDKPSQIARGIFIPSVRVDHVIHKTSRILVNFFVSDYSVTGLEHCLGLLLDRESLVVGHSIRKALVRLCYLRCIVGHDSRGCLREGRLWI